MTRHSPLALKFLQDRLAGALLKLMANERTQPLVNRALFLYQKGRGQLTILVEDLLHALGFATRSDFNSLEARIFKLEKAIQELGSSPHTYPPS